MYLTEHEADKHSLLAGPEWHITDMPSCCQAIVVCRLESGYRSGQPAPGTTSVEPIPWRGWNNREYYQTVKKMDTGSHVAIPLDYAFGAVLAYLHTKFHSKLFIATDNVREAVGDDVHRGPFSTKGFIFWAAQRGYIKMHWGGNQKVHGYVFTLTPQATRGLQYLRNGFRRYVNPKLAAHEYRAGGWSGHWEVDYNDEDTQYDEERW